MNYYKKLLDNLNDKHVSGSYKTNMLRHLVIMLGEEKFNENIEKYFKGGYPDSFDGLQNNQYDEDFCNFHKSMRQCDFYDREGGHLDMLWWNFIQVSNETYKQLRYMFDE